MKRKTVNKVLAAAFTMAFVCAAGGVATYTFDASADVTTPTTLSEVSFDMVYGASMRVATEEKPNATTGLRFSAKMPVEHYNWLVGEYGEENVSFGTIIMPTSYATVTVDEDSLFGDKATYTWKDKTEQIGTVTVLQMDGGIYEYTDDKTNETYMRVNGSIGPVKPGNYNREFFGVCYMAVNTGAKVEYFCATANDNERSLLYIAQAALDKEGWATDSVEYTTTKAFVDGYIASYKAANNNSAPMVNYTVNKIYDDGKAMETATYQAELGAKITLDEEAYNEGVKYEIDKTKSTMSGTAYTQDKLTLNVYYKKVASFVAGANVTNLTDTGNNVWTFNPTANYIVVQLTQAYVADLVERNVAAVSITFANANPNGNFAFNWEGPKVGTEFLGLAPVFYNTYEHPCTWTVDVTDLVEFGKAANMYFYQHTGESGNPYAETIQMTVKEITSKEAAYVKTNFGVNDVTYNDNLTWTFAMAAKDFGVHLSGDYFADAISRGIGKITLSWTNPNGSYIVDWAAMSFGTRPTNYPSSFSWTLDETVDYSAGLTLRMFHHDNISGSAQKVEQLRLTITETKKEDLWVTGVASISSVTHVSDLTWEFVPTAQYTTIKLTGEYLKEAVRKGVTDITLKFSNPDGNYAMEFLSCTFGMIPRADNYRYVSTWKWSLSQAADYSNGLEIYFYHNNGSTKADRLRLTITEGTTGGTIRDIRNIASVTVVDENTTKLTASDVNYQYIDFYISGDYLTQAAANGAKSITIKFANAIAENGIACDWREVSIGSRPTNYPSSWKLTLDDASKYSVGLYVRMYLRDESTKKLPKDILVTLTQNM